VEQAWREAQDIVQRALPLLRACAPPRRIVAAQVPAGGSGSNPEASLDEVDGSVHEAPPPPEDASQFFAQEVARGLTCIDCGLPDADWASVSYGTYLCVDCAGRHRGLGVHLSFVRSTTMDIWSKGQLRRMQLGGSNRFREFLRSYPKLVEEPQTSAALMHRSSF
ncbi:unnamed protein product, partial [Polarella glacialis]